MKTVKVDSHKRIRLPWARPGQVYAAELDGENRFLLALIKPKPRRDVFPPSSLKKMLTKEYAAEQLAIVEGCAKGPR